MDAIPNTANDKHRAYRRRLAAKGNHQIVVALPREIVALLDEVQQRGGLPNRSQAVLQCSYGDELVRRGRRAS